MIKNEWFEDNNVNKGYKWSIKAEHGTVSVSEGELFNREEFKHFNEQADKMHYALELGWRFNVDNQMWYRIKGY